MLKGMGPTGRPVERVVHVFDASRGGRVRGAAKQAEGLARRKRVALWGGLAVLLTLGLLAAAASPGPAIVRGRRLMAQGRSLLLGPVVPYAMPVAQALWPIAWDALQGSY